MLGKTFLRLFSLLILCFSLFSLLAADPPPTRMAFLLNVDHAIGPATSDYIQRGIQTGIEKKAELIIIRLDTPGGLDKSMRDIIKTILASPIPIVTYVAPSGARAASAGTFLLYASHIAAMAPGTNLGAASPVSIGGETPTMPNPNQPTTDDDAAKSPATAQPTTLENKVKNDAVAYIRALAQLRDRDVEFAEQAVESAATLTAEEAEVNGVIDVIANNITELLLKLNQTEITLNDGRTVTLNTENLTLETINPDWRTKFLAVITDPSVAYILLLIGIYGLFFEFANPGFVLPGVAGAIALLLALYALHTLPINYAGLALMILGIIFIIAEAFVPSFGALGFGGVVAFIIGSILLMDSSLPGYQIAWPLIISMALANLLFFFIILGMAARAKQCKIVSGSEDLIDRQGKTLEPIDFRGQAKIQGEIWIVETQTPLQAGQAIIVTGINGLILQVKPLEPQ